MEPTERGDRRDTFLAPAFDYRDVRPTYPPELLQVALELGHVPPGGSILEVGCGTGQATRWFAERGFVVTAIDRSEEMVRVAQAELEGFAGTDVRCEDFEAGPTTATFDALLAATSYHWLDPEDRVARCHAHLKPHGSLLLLWNTHPLPYEGFFRRVQSLYEQHVPEWAPPTVEAAEERVARFRGELLDSGHFAAVARRSLKWSRTFDRESYVRLLGTFSDHATLADHRRVPLLTAIGELIDLEYDGSVVRPYCTELLVGTQ